MLNVAGFLIACLKSSGKSLNLRSRSTSILLTYKLTCTGPVLLFAAFALDHQYREDTQQSLGLVYNPHSPMMGKLSDHDLQGLCDEDGVGIPDPSTCNPGNVISFGSLTSHS